MLGFVGRIVLKIEVANVVWVAARSVALVILVLLLFVKDYQG